MHSNDERPPTPGRPSLHPSDQQADPDRLQVIGKSDGKDDIESYPRSGFGKFAWTVTAALLLALAAAGVLWSGEGGEKQIVLAEVAPSAAEPPMFTETDLAAAEADYASSVAVLEDDPVSAPIPVPEEAKAPAKVQDLKLLTPKREARPAAAKVKSAKPKVTKAAVRPHKKPASKTTARRKPETVRTVTAPPADNDVALLSALMAHSKATAPAAPVAPEMNFKQCKALKKASEVSRCIARLCSGSAKGNPQCRS